MGVCTSIEEEESINFVEIQNKCNIIIKAVSRPPDNKLSEEDWNNIVEVSNNIFISSIC